MDHRVLSALDYIKRHYNKKIKLADLSKVTHLSAFHLQRLFKRETGESPNDYLRRIRLEKAAHLLKVNPDKSLTDIASYCGFSSLASFSRSFRIAYQQSPSAYRLDDSIFLSPVPLVGSPNPEVEIVYFPETWIYYRHTSVFFDTLYSEFEAARATAQADGFIHPNRRLFGAYVHIPFHAPQIELNYFAGVEVDVSKVKYKDALYCLPSGRYAVFETKDSYDDLTATMVRFKKEWLDKQPYYLKDIFAMEEMFPGNQTGNYPCLSRRIYIPIEGKR